MVAAVLCGSVLATGGAAYGQGADTTPPVVTPVVTGEQGAAGWYTRDVSVRWSVSDPESGVAATSAGCAATTVVTETAGQVLACTARNRGGRSATGTVTIKLDKTAPVLTGVPSGPRSASGWYTGDVAIAWNASDPISGVATRTGCAPAVTTDTPGLQVPCAARNAAGLEVSTSVYLRLDETPPTVTPVPSRRPDRRGIYNRPLTVRFSGSDGTSGLEGCSVERYAGPSADRAVVSGVCRDQAGLTATASFPLRYDNTAPGAVTELQATEEAGAVLLAWRSPADPDFDRVEVRRVGDGSARTVYSGPRAVFRDVQVLRGRTYRYVLFAYDRAGNASRGVTRALATAAALELGSSAAVERSSSPLLRWHRVPAATYYNLQLFRGGRKVLSTWPRGLELTLDPTWRYGGRAFSLLPGSYRWFVWPGFGPRREARYGKPLGSGSFVVR